MTYTELINDSLNLYIEGKYSEALNLLKYEEKRINKGIFSQIDSFKACIACKAGMPDEGMDILKNAIFNKGFWYSQGFLLEDDDLELIRDSEDFKKILDKCSEREKRERNEITFTSKELLPNNKDFKGWIIALHGNQENIDLTEYYWKDCMKKNYALSLFQSDDIEFSDAYSWNNYSKASKELQKHIDLLEGKYKVLKNKLILGGFSAGAGVVLETILNKYVLPNKCILVAPWIPDIEKIKKRLNTFKEHNIEINIIIGTKDDDCNDCTEELINVLYKERIAYNLTLIDGLKHDYPLNFEEILSNMLN